MRPSVGGQSTRTKSVAGEAGESLLERLAARSGGRFFGFAAGEVGGCGNDVDAVGVADDRFFSARFAREDVIDGGFNLRVVDAVGQCRVALRVAVDEKTRGVRSARARRRG